MKKSNLFTLFLAMIPITFGTSVKAYSCHSFRKSYNIYTITNNYNKIMHNKLIPTSISKDLTVSLKNFDYYIPEIATDSNNQNVQANSLNNSSNTTQNNSSNNSYNANTSPNTNSNTTSNRGSNTSNQVSKESTPKNSPANTSNSSSYEQKVVDLVNLERTKRSLKPLSMNSELSRLARMKSKDMSDKGYFSHTSPTYGSPFDMMKQFGVSYRSAGENIAQGYSSPESVVTGWMNSPGHRKNILSPNFTDIGVGLYNNYWTQMFIGK